MLGLLSDSQFEAELDSLNRRVAIGSVAKLERGRNGVAEIDAPVRALIAETAIEGSTIADTARAFGVSESSVEAYKHGATSTASYNDPDRELAKRVNAKRQQINDSAHERIIAALNAITPAKLADASPKVNSAIARDLSAVVKNITPEEIVEKNYQIVVFAPPQKSEEDYRPAIRVE